MNYAIKVLEKQHKMVCDLLEETQKKYDDAMIESIMDIEFFETDIKNFQSNKKDLEDAVKILIGKNHKLDL